MQNSLLHLQLFCFTPRAAFPPLASLAASTLRCCSSSFTLHITIRLSSPPSPNPVLASFSHLCVSALRFVFHPPTSVSLSFSVFLRGVYLLPGLATCSFSLTLWHFLPVGLWPLHAACAVVCQWGTFSLIAPALLDDGAAHIEVSSSDGNLIYTHSRVQWKQLLSLCSHSPHVHSCPWVRTHTRILSCG